VMVDAAAPLLLHQSMTVAADVHFAPLVRRRRIERMRSVGRGLPTSMCALMADIGGVNVDGSLAKPLADLKKNLDCNCEGLVGLCQAVDPSRFFMAPPRHSAASRVRREARIHRLLAALL